MKEYFCILGGGGIRGAAYTGVIKALKNSNIKITGLGGSSIGAVVAGLLSFGYSEDDLMEIFENINFEFFKDLNFSFGKDFALSRGDNFYKWVKNKIEEKFYFGKENLGCVTFKDLKNELLIFAVDLMTSKFYEFSKLKTPDVEVAHAIRVSVGMPGLYAPVCDKNECLVDGDLSKGSPLFYLSPTMRKRKEKILEFRLEDNERKRKITNTFEYLNAVYDTLSGFATDFLIKNYNIQEKYDLIKINLDEVSVVDFLTSKDKKEEISKIGYDTTIKYFEEKYAKKEIEIKKIKEKISSSLEKIKFYMKNNLFEEGKIEILEIISNLICTEYKIDEKIIQNLIELKNLYNQNLVENKSIFGKNYTLVNSDKILNTIESLNNEINS